MFKKDKQSLVKKISSVLVFCFVWNTVIAPTVLGLKIQRELEPILSFLKTVQVHAQSSNTVPSPLITLPPAVTNITPKVQGQKLQSQESIIMCTPTTTSCPSNGVVVATGNELNFQVTLQPLTSGRNDFAFFAKTGTQYSAPVAFSVFYVSEQSVSQNNIPPELIQCINSVTSSSSQNTYSNQINTVYGSLPNDGQAIANFQNYNQGAGNQNSAGVSYAEALQNTFSALNPFQTNPIPEANFGSSGGSTTSTSTLPASNYSGGSYPASNIANVNSAASQALAGYDSFRFCIQTAQSSSIPGSSANAPNQGNSNPLSDYSGYFDEDGNFVLSNNPPGTAFGDSGQDTEFTEGSGGGTGTGGGGGGDTGTGGGGDTGTESGGGGSGGSGGDDAFNDVGRDYTDPGGGDDGLGDECVTDFDCNLGQICDPETSTCVEGCNYNDDCQLGYRCENQQCVAGCDTDADCQAGETCGADGQCSTNNQGNGSCQSDSDCSSGRGCKNGTCKKFECTKDDDCMFGILQDCDNASHECKYATGKIVLLALKILLGPLLALLGMCPSYYVSIDGVNSLIGFGLLGNIHKFAEDLDFIYIPLKSKQPASLKITIAEYVKELLHINTLKLRAVFHQADENVYLDQNTQLQVVKSPLVLNSTKNYNFLDAALSLKHMAVIGKFLPTIEAFRTKNKEEVQHASDRFDSYIGELFKKVAQRSASEFIIPSSFLNNKQDLILITDAKLSPAGMSQRLPIFDGIPQSEIEKGYEFFYNSESYIHQEVTDFLNDFTAIRAEVWDESKQEWHKIPGSFIQEQKRTRAFTIPANLQASKIRLVTREGAYLDTDTISFGLSVERSDSDLILDPISLSTNSNGQNISGHDLLDQVNKIDSDYLRIDQFDSLEAEFNLAEVWEKAKDHSVSLFIENSGYYEIERSL